MNSNRRTSALLQPVARSTSSGEAAAESSVDTSFGPFAGAATVPVGTRADGCQHEAHTETDWLGVARSLLPRIEAARSQAAAERCFPYAGARSELPGALWRGDFRSHLGGVAAVALGTARAAIDDLLTLAIDKVPFLGASTLCDRADVQAAVGRAEALVRSGRAWLYEVLNEMWQTQFRGGDVRKDQLALRDLAVVNAVQKSARAVELMYDSAGSTAVYATSNLERCFRDVHTITQHIAGASSRYAPLGRFFMDLMQADYQRPTAKSHTG